MYEQVNLYPEATYRLQMQKCSNSVKLVPCQQLLEYICLTRHYEIETAKVLKTMIEKPLAADVIRNRNPRLFVFSRNSRTRPIENTEEPTSFHQHWLLGAENR